MIKGSCKVFMTLANCDATVTIVSFKLDRPPIFRVKVRHGASYNLRRGTTEVRRCHDRYGERSTSSIDEEAMYSKHCLTRNM